MELGNLSSLIQLSISNINLSGEVNTPIEALSNNKGLCGNSSGLELCPMSSGSSHTHREKCDIVSTLLQSMSAMLSLAKQCAFEEPSVETITGENVLTWPHVVKYIDSYTVTISELETVTSKFKFNSMMRAPLHGFAFWFDVEFNVPTIPPTSVTESHQVNGSLRKKRTNPSEALVLSTAPEDPPTHWQQTLVYFYDPIELEQDQVIEGLVTLTQSKENARFMNIHLEYTSGNRSYVKESVMR
ncbi:putative protein arginine N-methyltransferase [Trifolium repens]|nr:putative protein arginine N-methyltransferase [Trifolium repens]